MYQFTFDGISIQITCFRRLLPAKAEYGEMQCQQEYRGSKLLTFSYFLMTIGASGLISIYFHFPSISEFQAIRQSRARLLGLTPYFVFMVSAHALAFGAGICLVYFFFPDLK